MAHVVLLLLTALAATMYLYWQYHTRLLRGKKMICLIGTGCDQVVGSKYGKTLGIKNELIGLLYYPLMMVLILAVSAPWSVPLVRVLAAVAALFSMYLLCLQLCVLRTYCFLCLVIIGSNLLVFWSLL